PARVDRGAQLPRVRDADLRPEGRSDRGMGDQPDLAARHHRHPQSTTPRAAFEYAANTGKKK
ncbi:MAG TPA: hypothetical protein VK039_07750, partial [Brevibacterium sp.]|nr:hypothetical protein [Brevibacterium sp.]